jgi:hypothetical protein
MRRVSFGWGGYHLNGENIIWIEVSFGLEGNHLGNYLIYHLKVSSKMTLL